MITDKAFETMCGGNATVRNDRAVCEECVIDHAAFFVVGWGCGADLTLFCDQ